MDLDTIPRDCREQMDKSVEYYERELRGIRAGRATTALIDYVKVDYYGSLTELRELAAVSVPDPTQLLIKPFDPTAKNAIVKAIETADLGLNPMLADTSIRINVPAPSAERRRQLIGQIKKMAEDARVAIRNERREANKHVDQLVKDKSSPISEDQGNGTKAEVETLTKKHIGRIDAICNKKTQEIEAV